MQQYLGCKLYISGEFLYQINIPSDPKWSEIKMSYCQKPKNLGQTKSKNGSISKRISFGTVIETTLQNSLSFIDKEVHIDNHNLQWGPTCDPLRSFQILASFPQSEYSSDLELTPSIASYIHIYAQFREPKEEWLLLSRNLKDIINSWSDSDSNFMFSMENEEISHVRRNSNTSINISSPLNYSKYSISKLTEKIIHSLFNEVTYTCTKSVNFRKSSNLDDVLSTPYLAFNFFSSRAVPYQSFLWKLIYNCLIMVSTSDDYKKLDLNSILRAAWNEIVRMLRSYWENKTIIPNVNTPHNEGKYEVDLRFNILHQKISMLNYCIDRSNKNFFQTPKNKNKIKEADKSNSNSSSFPSNFRRLSKREPISDLSHDPSPKGQFVKGDISSLQSFWNDKIQTEQKETNSNDINNQLEENLGSLSISSKSCKSLAYNALQGSPELVSPPSSYPKDSIDSYTEDIKYHSQNISEKESSFEKKSFPVPVNKNGHSHKVFNQSVVRENSLAAESFVQLHCPSSISSYNSVSDIVFASASPKVNSIGKQSSNVMNNEPQGRLKVLESCRLLKHDEPIYIPITQDPGVMSEDMLLDQAQLFEKLGTSETGARRRAQLQGAQLLSDMEAFKAANPKSCLIDFVRWHSPRDWVVGDKDDNVMTESRVKELNGKLSARMENPDNLWQELWAKAKPIPVYLQKPLFDYMSEGEKALHYIENISIEDLYHLLLPTIFLITYDTLLNSIPKEHFTGLKHLQTKINSFGNELMGFPWQHQE
ncbi:hypothetical protein K502DRAFT_174597 [Neoconidiobolus thromboides FSU 785]|nr:hypothetical protein K502DRAFT_174597 [Neoconidiobolus thromboides FSU 785]